MIDVVSYSTLKRRLIIGLTSAFAAGFITGFSAFYLVSNSLK